MVASGRPAVREEVMRLTQLLASESAKVSETFIAVQRMHSSDVLALTQTYFAEQQGEHLTAGSLATTLGLTSGAVTGLLDRLEEAGRLHRVRDPQDRRRVLLETSAEGRAVAEDYLVPVRQRSEEVVDRFTTDELSVVCRYLAATADAMAAHRRHLVEEHDV